MPQQKGFTLLELVIVVVILGVLAAMAIPSTSDFIDKRKIVDAAEAVYGQLLFARSQAISRSDPVYVNFGYDPAGTDDKSWLVSVSTNANCAITEDVGTVANTCTLIVTDGDADLDPGDGSLDMDDLVWHVTSGSEFNDVELDFDGVTTTNGTAPNEIEFNPVRGTASPSETIHLTYSRYEMHIIVSPIGRVRICTPDGDKQVPGYTECP